MSLAVNSSSCSTASGPFSMLHATIRAFVTRNSTLGHRGCTLHKRTFFGTFHPAVSLSLPSTFGSELQVVPKDKYIAQIRQQKYDALTDSLSRDHPNPNLLWGYYLDLLEFCSYDDIIPLQIHQQVLRKCTRPLSNLRAAAVKINPYKANPSPHTHETRFLTVIHNIRGSGWTPDLDDYHFILSHFAAVGHHKGAVQVLREIREVGLELHTKAYGLCLQAIACRLSLPRREEDSARLRDECVRLCMHIVDMIRKRNSTIPSACLDLALRILKDSERTDVFASVIKAGYGIDLDFPDRPPLTTEVPQKYVPFSASALTTVVDYFGRRRMISKMVSVFEVLNSPLPNGISPLQGSIFDEEDEDDAHFFSRSSDASQSDADQNQMTFANVTTYNTLIRHCARAMHTVLTRHYILQAMEIDRISSNRLREDMLSKPLSNVIQPVIRVNVDTFRPVVGLANRNRDLGLLRWAMWRHRRCYYRKREDLAFFLNFTKDLRPEDSPSDALDHDTSPNSSTGEALPDQIAFSREEDLNVLPDVDSSDPKSTFFTSRFPSATSSVEGKDGRDTTVAMSGSNSISGPLPPDTFDLALHLRVLKRDLADMKELDKRIGTMITRLHDRRKERLGRRVWEGKDIYLSDANQRTKMSREEWNGRVNFQKSKKQSQRVELHRRQRRRWT